MAKSMFEDDASKETQEQQTEAAAADGAKTNSKSKKKKAASKTKKTSRKTKKSAAKAEETTPEEAVAAPQEAPAPPEEPATPPQVDNDDNHAAAAEPGSAAELEAGAKVIEQMSASSTSGVRRRSYDELEAGEADEDEARLTAPVVGGGLFAAQGHNANNSAPEPGTAATSVPAEPGAAPEADPDAESPEPAIDSSDTVDEPAPPGPATPTPAKPRSPATSIAAQGQAKTPSRNAYLVLARKYRPQTFDDLIGQEHVVRTLTNAIEQDRIHHAYLFTGSRGIGKTTSARILAKALNCVSSDKPTPTPCGTCVVCQQIQAGQGAETYTLNEIDGASNRDVESARELRRSIAQKTGARYHVIVIDEVHMLTKDAFNTLLKTLEEPPAHVKFVFATTEVQKVPETIISRCQRFDFRRIGAATIAQELQRIAGIEGIELEAEAAKLIARVAEGGMRDSLSKLDQAIAFCGTSITAADVERIFGILSRRALLTLIASFRSRDFAAALEVARRIHEEGLDTAQVLRDLVELFRDLAVVRTCGADTPLIDAMDEDRAAMQEVAGQIEVDTLLYAVEILVEGQRRIRTSGFPRLALEMTFIKLCELDDLVAVPALVEALARGGGAPSAAKARGGGGRGTGAASVRGSDPGRIDNEDEPAKRRSFTADLAQQLKKNR